MKNIIENNEDQFANSQVSRDLRVNSDVTKPETRLEVVNVIEQCPDKAPEEFSAPENWERKRQRRGSQFLLERIDADERLPGYLRDRDLPRFESQRARVFASSAFLKETPLYVLNPSQTNEDQFLETPESDAANTDATSASPHATC